MNRVVLNKFSNSPVTLNLIQLLPDCAFPFRIQSRDYGQDDDDDDCEWSHVDGDIDDYDGNKIQQENYDEPN